MTDMLVRICGIALLCVIAGMILKHMGGDMAIFARIAGCILIFAMIIPVLGELVDGVRDLIEKNGIDTYASVMLKSLGVAILSRICSDICRDCGEGSLAGGVELAGKAVILLLCIPLIGEIIGYASWILEME